MDSWKSNRLLFFLTSAPAAFWLVVFFLVPLVFVWVLSFGEVAGIIDISISWTGANYARAFDPLYLGILWQSVWIAGLATAICLLVGFPVALGISFAPRRWKTLLLLLIILPFWTNLLIRTYALIAVLRRNGYINDTLAWFWGLSESAFELVGLNGVIPVFVPLDLLYNHGAVVFGLVYVHLPFMVLPLYAALERMDRSYVEASLDLGAGQFRTMLLVIVPLAMPGIVSGLIITFIPALGSFLTPVLLGGPDSEMIGTVIERQFKSANDWPFGAALSFLLMYVTFAALALRAAVTSRRQKEEMI